MVRVATHLITLGALLAVLAASAAAEDHALAVITHPSRPIALTTNDLRRFFLKQRRFWPDGSPVIPINRSAATPARTTFDESVFGAEVSSLAAYWNQRYFEGLFPPLTLDSAEAVQRYVAARPNAVGYVDAASVDASVHVAVRLPASP
jgi:hypothetical protein